MSTLCVVCKVAPAIWTNQYTHLCSWSCYRRLHASSFVEAATEALDDGSANQEPPQSALHLCADASSAMGSGEHCRNCDVILRDVLEGDYTRESSVDASRMTGTHVHTLEGKAQLELWSNILRDVSRGSNQPDAVVDWLRVFFFQTILSKPVSRTPACVPIQTAGLILNVNPHLAPAEAKPTATGWLRTQDYYGTLVTCVYSAFNGTSSHIRSSDLQGVLQAVTEILEGPVYSMHATGVVHGSLRAANVRYLLVSTKSRAPHPSGIPNVRSSTRVAQWRVAGLNRAYATTVGSADEIYRQIVNIVRDQAASSAGDSAPASAATTHISIDRTWTLEERLRAERSRLVAILAAGTHGRSVLSLQRMLREDLLTAHLEHLWTALGNQYSMSLAIDATQGPLADLLVLALSVEELLYTKCCQKGHQITTPFADIQALLMARFEAHIRQHPTVYGPTRADLRRSFLNHFGLPANTPTDDWGTGINIGLYSSFSQYELHTETPQTTVTLRTDRLRAPTPASDLGARSRVQQQQQPAAYRGWNPVRRWRHNTAVVPEQAGDTRTDIIIPRASDAPSSDAADQIVSTRTPLGSPALPDSDLPGSLSTAWGVKTRDAED